MQSLQEDWVDAWSPLGFRGRHRAFRRTGWTRGRPWAAAACRAEFVVGAALCEPGVQISRYAQRLVNLRSGFVAGAVHRAFRRTRWTPGRCWAAAACRADFVAGTALCDPAVQISWYAHRFRRRRSRWAAAACCADFVAGAALCEPGVQISWYAQRLVNLQCRFRDRRSTQSLEEYCVDAWSPLGRGCLSCRFRGRRSAW